jgi:predicted transcriptional regulator
MDESLFIRVFGIKSPMLKVLDFLMDNESFDYSKTDIAEGIGLSRATLFKAWPKLEALDLITATRTVGQAKMYKLNKQNPITKKLMELDDAISEYFALKHCSQEPGQDLITAIVDDKRDRHEELLLA